MRIADKFNDCRWLLLDNSNRTTTTTTVEIGCEWRLIRGTFCKLQSTVLRARCPAWHSATNVAWAARKVPPARCIGIDAGTESGRLWLWGLQEGCARKKRGVCPSKMMVTVYINGYPWVPINWHWWWWRLYLKPNITNNIVVNNQPYDGEQSHMLFMTVYLPKYPASKKC